MDVSIADRRRFLMQAGAGIAAGGWGMTQPRIFWADEKAADEKQLLIVRQEKPFNAEPPMDRLLEHWITSNELFFQRSHGNVPEIDADAFRLSVEGLVDTPLKLSLGELKDKFPAASATATLTCAGNRRNEFEKKVAGVQWHAGAIGNAEWKGVNLADVLKSAGLKPEARHVWFEGLDDVVEGGGTIAFGGSIPLDKAMSGTRFTPGALLVHTMNGQPLSKEHGAPLRSLVPGFIGARSVKWLGKITVSDRPSPNHFLAGAYKVITEGTPAEIASTSPIYQYVLNSVIGDWTASKPHVIVKGYALPTGAPESLIRRVEVSIDGGKTWKAARLTSAQREFCWTLWEAELPADALGKTALVRAIDTRGDTQPEVMPSNLKGYQFNGWHHVELKS